MLEKHPETRWGLNFLALLGVIVALALGKSLLMPLVVALMLAAVCWPLVELLRVRWWLPRGVAAIVVMTGLICAMTLGIIWIVVAVQSNFQELSTPEGRNEYYTRLHNRVAEDLSIPLAHKLFPLDPKPAPEQEKPKEPPVGPMPEEQAKQESKEPASAVHTPATADHVTPEKSIIFGWLNKQFSMEGNAIPALLLSTTEVSMIALLVLFLALFLWIDGEMMASRTAEIFGPRTGPYFSAALRALEEMAKQVRAYIVWRTVINLGITIILGFTYTGMGLKQPWTWAIFAGVMGYIPYIGHFAGCIPAVFDGFVNRDFVIVIYILVVYGVLLLVEGYIIFPLVVGRHMEMNATTVILACLFWQLVWGSIGLFLAMPLTAGIKAICANVPMLRPWANLMGQHELPNLEEAAPEVWPDPQHPQSVNGAPAAATKGASLLEG